MEEEEGPRGILLYACFLSVSVDALERPSSQSKNLGD